MKYIMYYLVGCFEHTVTSVTKIILSSKEDLEYSAASTTATGGAFKMYVPGPKICIKFFFVYNN